MAAAKPERGPSGARPAADAEPFTVPALRQQAEAALRARAVPLAPEPNALGPDSSEQTLHELRVHQIELEMQNEELALPLNRVALSSAITRPFSAVPRTSVVRIALG